jgi:hypothetical protein
VTIAWRSLRAWLGVAMRDWPRYRRAMREPVTVGQNPARGWISLCNRIESITPNVDGPGVRCDWEWGSDLHACHVWPRLGQKLLQVALREWPIRFSDHPQPSSGPRMSFIIAHGGRDRLPQLQRTIRSLFAQTEIDLECVVVDQTAESILEELPSEVIGHHLRKNGVQDGWHKAWAYNVGARRATGEILVFHDGDICVPHRYGTEIARAILSNGNDAASLQRFLFYLSPNDTTAVETNDDFPPSLVPARVYQNWKGGTIAIRRESFFSIGGFDEGFVDWGGEDDEFFQRCRLGLKHCRFGYLPFVHLWHPPQPGRKATDNPNIARVMPWRMNLPVTDRIVELTERRFGDPTGPDPEQSYKSTLQHKVAVMVSP